MTLTVEQQRKAEENIGLVGKVLQDKVHGDSFGIYTREDLFQIGCVGLCKAAATDKGGCFSTYAYRLIWNEICTALIYASRRSNTELAVDLPFWEAQGEEGRWESATEGEALLEQAEQSAAGGGQEGDAGHPAPGKGLFHQGDRGNPQCAGQPRHRLGGQGEEAAAIYGIKGEDTL